MLDIETDSHADTEQTPDGGLSCEVVMTRISRMPARMSEVGRHWIMGWSKAGMRGFGGYTVAG